MYLLLHSVTDNRFVFLMKVSFYTFFTHHILLYEEKLWSDVKWSK